MRISLFSSWTSLAKARQRHSHLRHSPPWLPQSTFFLNKKGSQAGSTLPAHSPTSRSAGGNRKTPRQAPAPQRTVVAHSVDSSANCKCRISHLGNPQLRASNSHASSLDLDLGTAPFSLERTTTPTPLPPHIPHVPSIVFADGAHLIAEAHVRDHSFSANSRASQIGASTWFLSVAFWVCLELVAARH